MDAPPPESCDIETRSRPDLCKEICNGVRNRIECYFTHSELYGDPMYYDHKSRRKLSYPTYYRVLVTSALSAIEYIGFRSTVITGALHGLITVMLLYHQHKVGKLWHTGNEEDAAFIFEAFNNYERLVTYWRLSDGIVLSFVIRMILHLVGLQLQLATDVSLCICIPLTVWFVCNKADRYIEGSHNPYAWWFGGSFQEQWLRYWLYKNYSKTLVKGRALRLPPLGDSVLSLAMIIPLENPIATLRRFVVAAFADRSTEYEDYYSMGEYRWNCLMFSSQDFSAFVPSSAGSKIWIGSLPTGHRDPQLYRPLIMLQRANAFDYTSVRRFSDRYISKVLDVGFSLELVAAILPNACIVQRLGHSVGMKNVFKAEYKQCIQSMLAAMYIEEFLPLHTSFLSKDTMRFFVTALNNLPEGETFNACFLDVHIDHVDWEIMGGDNLLSMQILDALSRHVVSDADFTFVWIGLRVFMHNLRWLQYRPLEHDLEGAMLKFLKALQDYMSGLSNDVHRQRKIGQWLRIYFFLIKNSSVCLSSGSLLQPAPGTNHVMYDDIVDIVECLQAKFPLTNLSREDETTLAQYRPQTPRERKEKKCGCKCCSCQHECCYNYVL